MSPGPARGRGTRSVPAAGSPTLASPAGDRRGCGTGSPPLGAARTPALGGALEEGPRGRPCAGVSVSVPPAHRALPPPPPPRLCLLSSLLGAGGAQPAPLRSGRGQHFRKRNWSREHKGAARGSPRGAPEAAGEGAGWVGTEGWAPVTRPFSVQAHSRPCGKHPWEKGGKTPQTAPVTRTWPLVCQEEETDSVCFLR